MGLAGLLPSDGRSLYDLDETIGGIMIPGTALLDDN